MIVDAKAVKLGDNIDTDVILPGKYLVLTDPAELGNHALEGLAGSHAKLTDGVAIAAGENFGQGSSREHAPIALKAAGVRCVVAHSIARIFYRNSIAIGLPVVQCPGILAAVNDGDRLLIDLARGQIRNLANGTTVNTEPVPNNLLSVLEDGGIIEYLKRRRTRR